MMQSTFHGNCTCHLVLFFIIIITANVTFNSVDAGSNDDFNYNYHRDQRSKMRRRIHRTANLKNNNDDDITGTLMNSDSTIRSTVLLRKDENNDDVDSSRISKLLLVHDDMNIDVVDEDLLFRHRNNKVEMSSSRRMKELNLAWRSEPPNVITADDNDNINDLDTTTIPWYQSQFTKTGTTIVGICGNDYCILGADSRATSNTMVADKYCHKIHPLTKNCAAAGAGTSADLDHITRECYYQIQLWLPSSSSPSSSFALQSVGNHPVTINTSSSMTILPQISVQQICRYLQHRLYEQRGTCQANLIVGGIEMSSNGCKGRGILRAIHPHGSIDVVSYTALGSGSYAAMGVLESAIHNNTCSNNDGHTPHNLTIDEAIELVVKAVKAGIDHDLGSGSQVDLCIITSNGIANYTRCYVPEEKYFEETAKNIQDFGNSLTHSTEVTTKTSNENSDIEQSLNSKPFQKIGINGFGNVPYVVRSKRVQQYMDVHTNYDDKTTGSVERWKDILPTR